MQNELTAASDALNAAYRDFIEARQSLDAGIDEVENRIKDDTARDAARADELEEEAAVSTGVRAVMLAQRAKDCRAKTHGMTDTECALLAGLKADAEEKLSALRVVRQSAIDAAETTKKECDALRASAGQIELVLCERWIDTAKFESVYGRIE